MACRLMPPSEPSRVFISYARKDGAALAQRLHQDLTDEGFVVWLDVQRLTGGDIWRQEIAEAISAEGSFPRSNWPARSEQALDIRL
jgi:hypothetical protein